MKNEAKIKRIWKQLVLVAIICILMSSSTLAATQKAKALKAYRQFLSQSVIRHPQRYYYIYLQRDYHKFALIYLNNDKIPELIISHYEGGHAAGYGSLYTYYNGKVRFVTSLSDNWYYYKKKGILYDQYSNQGYKDVQYFRFSGKNCKKIASYSLKMGKADSKKFFNSKNKKISKKSFDRLIKKYVGRTKKSADFSKYAHNNTNSNRKRYIR